MSWKDDLTDEQIPAASFCGLHTSLLAGPGTGKTFTLTKHILYLIEEKNIHPSQITILTFTRAATAELKERIKEKLDDKGSFPKISTLHSFALRMILKNSTRTILPQPIRIADDYEERWIIKEEIKDILDLQKIKEVVVLFNKLSADWETLTARLDGWENRFPDPQFLGVWQEHRRIYGYTLRSELVYQLKLALEEEGFEFDFPIRHLLVDEYQDLNPCDLAVIKHLTNFGAELFCSGDDDQSIYGFRYANPEGIRKFSQEYIPSKSFKLETCMRCDKGILDLGMYVAQQDPRRIPKILHCKEGAECGEVRTLCFKGQRQEANGIAEICDWLINVKNIDPSQILILVRSDRNGIFSEVLYKSLQDKDVPIRIVSNPLAVLGTFEGRYFVCLLHLLTNRYDSLAWRVLLGICKNGIGDKTLKKIYEIARTKGITFFEAIEYVARNPQIIPGKGDEIQQEMNNIYAILNQIDLDSIEDLSKFIETFANEVVKDVGIRTEVISLFKRVVQLTEEEDLEKLLRAVNISLEHEEQDIYEGCVSIMTMHQAKGLNADAVFIVAAEDEYIPGRARGEEINDERRLLYVSLTRARHYLFVTHCQRRTGKQRHSGRTSGSTRRTLSRFLRDGPFRSIEGIEYANSLR